MAKILTSARELEGMARKRMNDPTLGHLEVRPDPSCGFRFYTLSDHIHGHRLELIARHLRASFGLKDADHGSAMYVAPRSILNRSRLAQG